MLRHSSHPKSRFSFLFATHTTSSPSSSEWCHKTTTNAANNKWNKVIYIPIYIQVVCISIFVMYIVYLNVNTFYICLDGESVNFLTFFFFLEKIHPHIMLNSTHTSQFIIQYIHKYIHIGIYHYLKQGGIFKALRSLIFIMNYMRGTLVTAKKSYHKSSTTSCILE